jgi:hypothetical protein
MIILFIYIIYAYYALYYLFIFINFGLFIKHLYLTGNLLPGRVFVRYI